MNEGGEGEGFPSEFIYLSRSGAMMLDTESKMPFSAAFWLF